MKLCNVNNFRRQLTSPGTPPSEWDFLMMLDITLLPKLLETRANGPSILEIFHKISQEIAQMKFSFFFLEIYHFRSGISTKGRNVLFYSERYRNNDGNEIKCSFCWIYF